VEERARAESERLRAQSRQLMEQGERARGKERQEAGVARGGDENQQEVELQTKELSARMRALKEKQQVLAANGALSEEQRMQLQRQMEETAKQMKTLEARRRMTSGKDQPAPTKPGSAGGDDRARRLKHMRVAAENLRAAGMNDVAQAVMSKADEFEREMREARVREGAQRPPRGSGVDRGEVEAMRRELQQLREEVRRLRAEEQPQRRERPERPDRPEPPQPERPPESR
jgi:hypothetical protein